MESPSVIARTVDDKNPTGVEHGEAIETWKSGVPYYVREGQHHGDVKSRPIRVKEVVGDTPMTGHYMPAPPEEPIRQTSEAVGFPEGRNCRIYHTYGTAYDRRN